MWLHISTSVVLLLGHIVVQSGDKRPTASFCIPIRLEVVCRSCEMLQTKEVACDLEKLTPEMFAIVHNDVARYPI